MSSSRYLYGIHEPCPADVMPQGWILHLAEVGHSPEPHPGVDLRPWSQYGNILRIQHAWGNGGTLPLPIDVDGYIGRVVSLVDNSQGCDKWIVANEPNLEIEWPHEYKLWPDYVASIYDRCRINIHSLPGHEADEVLLAPVGPWNIQIGIDWIAYFEQLIAACENVDGFALHTYSRGSDPASVTSEDKMGAPYQMYYNGFRTYRDWLAAIPEQYRDRPAYITETNQNQPWEDANTGWVRAAYQEINEWNQGDGQTLRALILYRWPHYDQYYIEGKTGVIADFQQAQAFGYTWEVEKMGDLYDTSFEEEFIYYEGISELEVPPGWVPLWVQGTEPGENHRPEWKPETERVRTGKQAAKFFTTHSSHDAVLAYTIALPNSNNVTLSSWGATFTIKAGQGLRIGIDPLGRAAFPDESGIVWSDWWGQDSPDWEGEKYHLFDVTAMPQAGQVTVYLHSRSRFAAQTVASYWDDLLISQESGGGGGDVDYERIRQIVREELQRRDPVVWPG